MALPPQLMKKAKEKKEEKEVREGASDKKDMKKSEKKGKKDTEIISGIEGSEGVTKANDPRKKGAPSLDDENTDACMKKDKKGGKDCGCKHKNDSLTPQEYIAACKLGIQDRSRVYIRARLDSEQREDKSGSGTGKKCGASHIPKSSTCTKGTGGEKKKESLGTKFKKGAEAAATAGAIANLGKSGYQLAKGNFGGATKSFLTAGTLGNTAAASRARRAGDLKLAKKHSNRAKTFGNINAAIGIAGGLYSGQTQYNVAQTFNRGRDMSRRWANRAGSYTTTAKEGWSPKLKKNKDSIWADGFKKTDAETALSANAMNLATDKYAKEKRKRNAQGQPRNMIYANTFNT